MRSLSSTINEFSGHDGRLFDIAKIPVLVPATPEPMGGSDWCPGSGVAGDNCEFGHEVPLDFDPGIVWITNQFTRRDRRGGEEYVSTKPRCRRCEQVRRNYIDSSDEDLTKAKDWWYSHTAKCAGWWDVPRARAREIFILRGVTIEAIADLFRHVRAHGTCPDWTRGGCGYEFDGGRRDITGDIKDPGAVKARGYITLDDIHGQCKSCNLAKGSMSWQDWMTYCAFHEWCRKYRPEGWQEPLSA